MYNNDLLSKDDIAYWSFIDLDYHIFLAKIEVLKIWYDSDNKTKVTKIRFLKGYSQSMTASYTGTDAEYPWQLQKTLEDAKRVMIMGAFRDRKSWYRAQPPWSNNV